MKIKIFGFVFFAVLFSVFYVLLVGIGRTDSQMNFSSTAISEADFYEQKIQPIFNARCIACHSCLESPCQLNLQSYEGVLRGGIQGHPVYNGTRLQSVAPTRMFEDALSTSEWREKGFHDIIGDSKFSILTTLIELGSQKWVRPTSTVEESQSCVKDRRDFIGEVEIKRNFTMAMPYGLPSLAEEDINAIRKWVTLGAPGPEKKLRLFTHLAEDKIQTWETFLNNKSLKHRITARYLFEHLFLAHLYFPNENTKFYRLIRSKNKCDENILPISSKTPNDSPGVSEWYYCFMNEPGTIVYKNHIPYELSDEKFEWIQKNFINSKWEPKEFPSFAKEFASNPFRTFKDIPIKARYEFLLKDAQYHIMTFIKGPVCNGTMAVNSIQEQFYVLFMAPKSDLMSVDSQYFEQVLTDLDLPGGFGPEAKPGEILSMYRGLLNKRNNYRKAKTRYLEKTRPEGLKLEDVWDGDQENSNALLTVIRHDDNAKVVKGAFGDIPKTVFLLDYSIFERLVYNLVVNFDVFANVGHQTLTRLYMDFIRMESENNFLDFLPLEQRKVLKKDWYRGSLTATQLKIYEEMQFANIPNGISFSSNKASKNEFIQKIIFERLNEKVRGRLDPINWKSLAKLNGQRLTFAEQELSKLASVPGYIPRFFPELSFLVLKRNGVPVKGYSFVRHREHENVSWILGESFRLSPDEDTLSIARGYYGAYPNKFFTVEESEIANFVTDFMNVKSRKSFYEVYKKYSVDRMSNDFWNIYDFANKDLMNLDANGGGFIDLSRYEL